MHLFDDLIWFFIEQFFVNAKFWLKYLVEYLKSLFENLIKMNTKTLLSYPN